MSGGILDIRTRKVRRLDSVIIVRDQAPRAVLLAYGH